MASTCGNHLLLPQIFGGRASIVYPSLRVDRASWSLTYKPVVGPKPPTRPVVHTPEPTTHRLGDGTTTGVDAALTLATFLVGIGGEAGIAVAESPPQ